MLIMTTVETGAAPSASPVRPTLPQALLVLVALIVAMAGYIALSAVFGLTESYIGFLFVFSWLGLEQGKAERLPSVVLGACYGLALCWALQYLAALNYPPFLMALYLAAILFSILCLMMGWLGLLINMPAMLVLTVCTIPHIQQGANFPHLYLALVFSALYFAALVLGQAKLSARLKRR